MTLEVAEVGPGHGHGDHRGHQDHGGGEVEQDRSHFPPGRWCGGDCGEQDRTLRSRSGYTTPGADVACSDERPAFGMSADQGCSGPGWRAGYRKACE